jgi:hypothetical protein
MAGLRETAQLKSQENPPDNTSINALAAVTQVLG